VSNKRVYEQVKILQGQITTWIRADLDSGLKGLTKENIVLGEKAQIIAEDSVAEMTLFLSAIFFLLGFHSLGLIFNSVRF